MNILMVDKIARLLLSQVNKSLGVKLLLRSLRSKWVYCRSGWPDVETGLVAKTDFICKTQFSVLRLFCSSLAIPGLGIVTCLGHVKFLPGHLTYGNVHVCGLGETKWYLSIWSSWGCNSKLCYTGPYWNFYHCKIWCQNLSDQLALAKV